MAGRFCATAFQLWSHLAYPGIAWRVAERLHSLLSFDPSLRALRRCCTCILQCQRCDAGLPKWKEQSSSLTVGLVMQAEIKRILEEYTEKALRKEAPTTGRYNVV